MTRSANIRKCDQTTNKGLCFDIAQTFFRTTSGYECIGTGKRLDMQLFRESWNFHFSPFLCWSFACLVSILFLKFPRFSLYHRFWCLLTSGYIQQTVGIGGHNKEINEGISSSLVLPTVVFLAVTVGLHWCSF